MIDSHHDLQAIANDFQSAVTGLLRHSRADDESLGIAPAQLSALSVLVYSGAQSLGGLAAMEQVTPPSMTRTVDGLETRGLARRWREKADRRKLLVVATRKGKSILVEAQRIRLQQLVMRMATLHHRDLDMIEACTLILRQMLADAPPGAQTEREKAG